VLQDELIDAADGVAPSKDPVAVGGMACVTVTVPGCPEFPEPVAQGTAGGGDKPGVIVTVAV
jgi:hypothetical protein